MAVDFADLVFAWLLTLRTPIVDFDGLSQTLKEYSDERKYFDVFVLPCYTVHVIQIMLSPVFLVAEQI